MKKLSAQYLLFLAILTVAIITSQILVQKAISDSKTDSRIINISGRQRMLSQKITKAALKLQNSVNREEYYATKLELTNAADLWAQSHEALQHGSGSIDVSEMNKSAALNELFIQVQPYYSAILDAVDQVRDIGYSASQSGAEAERIHESIRTISNNEPSFLKLMNDITFEYDDLASQKVKELSQSEYYLLAVALVLIVLEAFFIFRPMFNTAKKKESEISELHDYVQKSISFLGKSQEDKTDATTQIAQAKEKIRVLKEANLELKQKLNDMENSKTIAKSEEVVKESQIDALNKKYEKKILNLEKELAKIKTSI
ncbi:hypothetical protein BFP72_16460 [Reichenbachiella sp. 5M10]|uniref:type IV pili methyl-accepting chemotaxis transducer N-terminal domain-containing protein n=1 Tax=Reichenbachiella sp. 5M10 TaxID=1889772 RepID=UPI000C14FA34|nr:type IV pili methyl-accepting chemotaxis transducer N-terminal domain-containing protein [Reichenbachiella sp. 5M10]PIB36880.1 hypothetical protein BFP72_16460 [Reichenbachiella sp. 5M10]